MYANSGARLDRLPISGFHWKILALISAGAMLDTFDVYMGSGIIAAMQRDGFSTLSENAVFMSVTFVGMLIGAGFAGAVGDRFGRRVSYQVNLMIFGLASAAACFAPDIEVLIGLRFIMGLGLGAELIVAAGTLCEFVPARYRGRWVSLMGCCISSGLLLSSLTSLLVIPRFGWRWMFAIAAVAALAVWAMRKRMPESPRWLEAVGRHGDADRVLRRIEGEVERRHGALPPVRPMPPTTLLEAPWRDFLRPALRARTLVAMITCIAINLALYGFVAWLPAFFIREGHSVAGSLAFSTLMACGSSTGALVAFALADRVARQKAIIGACVTISLLATVYVRQDSAIGIAASGFALVTSIYTLVALGLYGYIPELFPTRYRLRGTGIAGMAGKACAIVTPFVTAFLVTRFGVTGVLGLVIGVLAILVVAVLVLRIETSGKSLELISADGADGRAVPGPVGAG